jgi:hypothetical protein
MTSALLRKSLTDLSRRRARTLFTTATLAVAVASVSFFAVPTLIDRAMQEEAGAGGLADVTLSLRPLVLGEEDLAALEALPNVAAVEPRSRVETRVLVGDRRRRARRSSTSRTRTSASTAATRATSCASSARAGRRRRSRSAASAATSTPARRCRTGT